MYPCVDKNGEVVGSQNVPREDEKREVGRDNASLRGREQEAGSDSVLLSRFVTDCFDFLTSADSPSNQP
jgi:hypothetical protein